MGGLAEEWAEIERALDSPARRRVLSYLQQTGEPTTVDELVEHVAKHTGEQQSRMWGRHDADTALRWVHLPTLSKAELVDWGPDDETVELNEYARQLPLFSPLSDRVVETDDPSWA
ncbi:hypothetical protein [Haloarchaeobius sp. HME9146]|uniref:DUF7344 domain-containing protein n=1 Tax=Haloarchaeobius sp. HME9146 TaxID=2978732 RepID=UPI0021BFA7B2|nr:hypothetical protein [Haloarchaeobius sp. HME9146]MCT9097358.1 hypothetical protein [Haloarchaeobius sp. HME9146]